MSQDIYLAKILYLKMAIKLILESKALALAGRTKAKALDSKLSNGFYEKQLFLITI